MPLHLLLGRMTSSTPPPADHLRRTSPGMSLNRRYSSRGCQTGPSVKVKPVPSCSTWTFSSTSSDSFSDLTSTGTAAPLSVPKTGSNLTDAGEPLPDLPETRARRRRTPLRQEASDEAPEHPCPV